MAAAQWTGATSPATGSPGSVRPAPGQLEDAETEPLHLDRPRREPGALDQQWLGGHPAADRDAGRLAARVDGDEMRAAAHVDERVVRMQDNGFGPTAQSRGSAPELEHPAYQMESRVGVGQLRGDVRPPRVRVDRQVEVGRIGCG